MLTPCDVRLTTNQVHLWTASLDVSERVAGSLLRILSPDERTRAARFRFERDRLRFIARRGILRSILAEYTRQGAPEIQFRYSLQGRPQLAAENDCLEFNLAHSNGLALVAISCGRRVGVDIEQLQPLPDYRLMASVVFSISEQETLAQLPIEQRLVGWYNGWTRKEAYLKGRGDGLLLSPKAIDVSIAPGAPAALLANRLDPDDVARWSLSAVAWIEGYAGALAVEGEGLQVHHGRWVP